MSDLNKKKKDNGKTAIFTERSAAQFIVDVTTYDENGHVIELPKNHICHIIPPSLEDGRLQVVIFNPRKVVWVPAESVATIDELAKQRERQKEKERQAAIEAEEVCQVA